MLPLDLKSGFQQKTAFSVASVKKTSFVDFCSALKKAPSMFQRAIDDVLRPQIGKSCFVYVDDVIIFSERLEDHLNHTCWVLNRLLEANMRVSKQKSNFFKETNIWDL